MANVAIMSKYDKKWTVEDFEKLRDDLIEGKSIEREYYHGGNKNTEPEYVHALAVLEGLLEITEPIDKKPPEITLDTDTGLVSTSRLIYRKLNDKVLSIEFDEEIYHDFYSVDVTSMTLLNEVKDPRPLLEHSNLHFRPFKGRVIADIKNPDDGILLLQTYKKALDSQAYKKRLSQYRP